MTRDIKEVWHMNRDRLAKKVTGTHCLTGLTRDQLLDVAGKSLNTKVERLTCA